MKWRLCALICVYLLFLSLAGCQCDRQVASSGGDCHPSSRTDLQQAFADGGAVGCAWLRWDEQSGGLAYGAPALIRLTEDGTLQSWSGTAFEDVPLTLFVPPSGKDKQQELHIRVLGDRQQGLDPEAQLRLCEENPHTAGPYKREALFWFALTLKQGKDGFGQCQPTFPQQEVIASDGVMTREEPRDGLDATEPGAEPPSEPLPEPEPILEAGPAPEPKPELLPEPTLELAPEPDLSNLPKTKEALVAGGVKSDKMLALTTTSTGRVFVTGEYSDQMVIAGKTLKGGNGNNIYIAEYDPKQAKFINAITPIKSDTSDLAYGIATDNKGALYITGAAGQGVEFGRHQFSSANQIPFVAKFVTNTSPWGDSNWQWLSVGLLQSLPSNKTEIRGNDLVVAPDGSSIYVIGTYYGELSWEGRGVGNKSNNMNIFVTSLKASDGKVNWIKGYDGEGDDMGYGIAIDSTGANLYITGRCSKNMSIAGTARGCHRSGTLFVAKLQASTGKDVWGFHVENPGGTDIGQDIALDSKENIDITGNFSNKIIFGTNTFTSMGGQDSFVAKYDKNQQSQWAKQMGGPKDPQNSPNESGNRILIGSQGHVYVTGDCTEGATFGTLSQICAGKLSAYVTSLTQAGAWRWVRNAAASTHTKEDHSYALGAYPRQLFVGGMFQNPNTQFGLLTRSPTNTDLFLWHLQLP